MDESTALSILGFNEPVSLDDVKKSYRNLIIKNHPDKNSEYSLKKFLEILDSYVFLKDLYTRSDPEDESYIKFHLLLKKIFTNWDESKYRDALKNLQILMLDHSELHELFYVKAMTHVYLNDFVGAIQSFEYCTGFEKEVSFWNNMAFCYSQINNYAEIISCSDTILKLNPSNPEKWWFNKAISFYELGQLQKSIDCFEQVLKINPSDDDAKELRERTIEKLNKN